MSPRADVDGGLRAAAPSAPAQVPRVAPQAPAGPAGSVPAVEAHPAGPDRSDAQDEGAPATAPPPRRRVAVVFGGRSSEHGISCVTAAGVLRALDRERWDVVPVGIALDGRWVLAADDPAHWELSDGVLPVVDADQGPAVLAPRSPVERGLVALDAGDVPRALGEVDVVLPLLHGPFGEDGTLQGLLEMSDTRYVGSGVLSSAVAMDKHYAKTVLAAAGIPVGAWTLVTDRAWLADREARLDAALAVAEGAGASVVFVKPCRAGSSMGVTRVVLGDEPGARREGAREALAAAVEAAREHDPRVLVEAGVVGRELECGVLDAPGGAAPRASVVGEVAVTDGRDFYDFEAKYLDDAAVQLTCPADVDDEVAEAVRATALAAFEALGCEGLARVDVFATPDGRVVVNEVNTMPGFTPSSMFPRLWAASGLDYPALVDRLLELALERRTGLR
ncbi:D-alanine--D-alanine ligase family protein [uncultured Pseudokineococcus sp.]|uniref:D-alanine--D-alanine ligase family protein n=1 Tax=uncultured Pseudokineococcus sp. TaxID=1642928 RepID=UPI0026079D5E|nr:D-alanine--D-alanine ligase family protein [uncultured Pseudokineococcus sp.]